MRHLRKTTIDESLKIEHVAIDNVKLWKANPRDNDKAVDRLSELIAIHGQRTPIVVWSKNKTIYKGNTTWKAMKKLGRKKIAVLFADFPSESAAIAYGISDNKSSEWSAWDDDVLNQLLSSSELGDYKKQFGFSSLGLNEKEYSSLLAANDMPTKSADAHSIRDLVVSFELSDEIGMRKLYDELTKRNFNVKAVVI